MNIIDDTTSPMAHPVDPSQPPSDQTQQDPSSPNEASSVTDKKEDQALPEEKPKQNQEEERVDVTGREKLKKHRREVAGNVWIPDIWGQEDLLKDWIDCSTFDTCLVPAGISSARAALVEGARRAASASRGLHNRCLISR
ncbi:Uncharacterized protein Rs2_22488 [Raphanus sativus]|uniref:Protein BIC1 n=1 Tax=Raphanus sativus TaxID=3726 RepID=A0A6J0NVZ7_RAPSA|nr:protein BIC1 [Raphanus sativus]KAJ4895694.1 Uncharacterized protein Rs2_22488 [Raphanus sativus]